ncbi:MAG: UvrB/UvrC motif-containing protein [Verrucomicrobia bacterium]|nr:UvrB/UvrC motif-containing protein [Verrucomicrobiota bacterium]
MLCEKCQDKEATVHLTQVVEGAVKKIHLCEECAAESGFDVHGPMSITDILLGMGGESAASRPTPVDRSCPRCHMRQADFKKTGRLGCPTCYETFEDELAPLIKAMHRHEQHMGKVPSRESVRVRMSTEIAALQKSLERAVAQEHYEEAAEIRDRIRTCRQKMVSEEKKAEAEKDSHAD